MKKMRLRRMIAGFPTGTICVPCDEAEVCGYHLPPGLMMVRVEDTGGYLAVKPADLDFIHAPMSYDELNARYPRLIRAMRDVALLTEDEALSALQGYQINRELNRLQCCGAEAVVHFTGGRGPQRLIELALHHWMRRVRLNPRPWIGEES